MKAMILAAGRGERMRPLTDRIPKPLLEAGGCTLIERQVARLRLAGITDIVVNVSHLADRIEQALGNGAALGVRIRYSREAVALETAGGIAQALDLLGDEPFVAVNADIHCELDYRGLLQRFERALVVRPDWLAYLVLVDNPEHHPRGDFALAANGDVLADGEPRYTFSGIGIYRPPMFAGIVRGARHALGRLLRELALRRVVGGEHYAGPWMDIGTPERLANLRAWLERGDGSRSR